MTDGLSGEGGLNKLDSSEGFGLARKKQSTPKVEGECFCLSAFWLPWPLAAKPKKDGLFLSHHRWAR